MKKTCCSLFTVLLILPLIITNVRAQSLYPRIDVLGSYVFPQYQTEVIAGSFSLDHKSIRPCIEIGVDRPFSDHFFVGAGIRYNHYSTTIFADNVTPDIINNKHPFTWERGYTALTVPISFGIPIRIKGQRIGEVRVGAAFGILSTGYALNRASFDNTTAPIYQDTVALNIYIPSDNNPSFFFATLDFAATIYPFSKIPRLGITIESSFEVTDNNYISHNAWIENISKKQTFPYEIQNTTQFRTVSIGLRYNFRKNMESR
ncbi:MAG: hypothetical protein EOP52_00855 [Sphingobacteriales bacterium]|nr:MAG: hypothetical protein EOP52_00855 [Sphingobacteriales bacterium]